MARRGSQGLEVTLPGYSYAEDALLIYEAMEEWIRGYVELYYDDSAAGQKVQKQIPASSGPHAAQEKIGSIGNALQVTDDPELMAWWECVQLEGHPDKKKGWPKLTGIASLVAILATVLWTTGPHHAAVNYGQYQYSGYM